jgi:hypothetical protein
MNTKKKEKVLVGVESFLDAMIVLHARMQVTVPCIQHIANQSR